MLLTPTDFPAHAGLREVARALLYVAAPPPLTGLVEVDINQHKIARVRPPEREMAATMPLAVPLRPLTPAEWAVIHFLAQRLTEHATIRCTGVWVITVVAGVPAAALRWRPTFTAVYGAGDYDGA